MENSLSIYGINGPLVTVKGKTDLKMSEMVYVGKEKLVGEVIRLSPELATIQVFEETSGLKPGELLYPTGATLSVTLAPGIVSNIFKMLSCRFYYRNFSYITTKLLHKSNRITFCAFCCTKTWHSNSYNRFLWKIKISYRLCCNEQGKR